jgi:DNA repair protein RadA/Sms
VFGLFAWGALGLADVLIPWAVFRAARAPGISGAAVFAGMEGSRPLLVEIQALVGPSALGSPRRTVVGWDASRLAMLLAVLDARCGLAIGGRDVYLNVAGGLRISEPAADLAVAAALVSSLVEVAVAPATVIFGEVGLAGEVRAVSQIEARLKEATKLGFDSAILPAASASRPDGRGLRLCGLRRLSELVDVLGATPDPAGLDLAHMGGGS